jgi:hypothetical protein
MESILVLSFAIQPLDDHDETLSIVPVLDDIPLTRMIVDFERSHGFEPAGGYAGLVPTAFNASAQSRSTGHSMFTLWVRQTERILREPVTTCSDVLAARWAAGL